MRIRSTSPSPQRFSIFAVIVLAFAGVLTIGNDTSAAGTSCGPEFTPQNRPQITKPVIWVEVLLLAVTR
ncbi:hypothetical protein ABZ319_01660 [Nocardia sp. NPDC005978]|uniref:hypothetical protein n=1 Tax=Nocardia sp. NPDC005978 TaxID=3156725 RepID=UPI0033A2C5A6